MNELGDGSSGQGEASTVLNISEMVSGGGGNGTGAKLDAGDARCDVVATDGLGNWSDALRGHGDTPGIPNSTNMTGNATGSISTRPVDTKSPDSPS